MRVIRAILGALILFLDKVFTPKGVTRTSFDQQRVDEQTKSLSLYQFRSCPFCVKVRRAMKRQSLTVKTLDAKRCAASRKALLQGGGKVKVPCLRIEDPKGGVTWMYESSDIVEYLKRRFG